LAFRPSSTHQRERAASRAQRHIRQSKTRQTEAAGAKRLYLPPYSPDFIPIENAFSKLKALLRKAAEPTVDGLWSAIGRCLDLFSPRQCANYFEGDMSQSDREPL
jgi:transposase